MVKPNLKPIRVIPYQFMQYYNKEKQAAIQKERAAHNSF